VAPAAPTRNAFLNAAVSLGAGTAEDARVLEDFVVSDVERDYLGLLRQRYTLWIVMPELSSELRSTTTPLNVASTAALGPQIAVIFRRVH
jgi:hypothetical protein